MDWLWIFSLIALGLMGIGAGVGHIMRNEFTKLGFTELNIQMPYIFEHKLVTNLSKEELWAVKELQSDLQDENLSFPSGVWAYVFFWIVLLPFDLSTYGRLRAKTQDERDELILRLAELRNYYKLIEEVDEKRLQRDLQKEINSRNQILSRSAQALQGEVESLRLKVTISSIVNLGFTEEEAKAMLDHVSGIKLLPICEPGVSEDFKRLVASDLQEGTGS